MFGEVPATVLLEEQGLRFSVPLFDGQSWFYDQAANRHSLARYVKGMRVLDVFSYVGAWGLGAARAGASDVTCVDSSAPALELLSANARDNGLQVNVEKGDAFKLMDEMAGAGRKFDVVVTTRRRSSSAGRTSRRAKRAYCRLNQLAMQLLNRDGILVSCSCSYHLSARCPAGRHSEGRPPSQPAGWRRCWKRAGRRPIIPCIPAIPELKSFFCRVVAD